MALSDEQVNAEMQRLINFIKIEAMEKAREIHIKSNEEFAIEKAKIVYGETAKIDEFYKQKMKSASIAQQILKSNIVNKSRLRLLKEKENILNEIFEEVKEVLFKFSEDEERYQELLKVLILQGFLQLMETNVIVRGRASDHGLISKAIDDTIETFKSKTNMDLNVTIDKECLPSDGYGGIIIFKADKNILVNNTFVERLELLKKETLPVIRQILFG
ncbi:hypothetical protein T552_02412 [Pneumocystis carinii B80]|uniref:V-type proton ATPase subunit E n=1 Tax=Pneumocystis carinii (strain B80) TaxID=1408658 RepID=A0A0W4ZGF8_PNEC8|nr:hypothetical protein T552_02412 [Pneumocystis carinii B80]KTW27434.1 hypothetical protein T552_02412 [Pneumocystis carinii B80]